jgi:pimeloyl-ACP methyl ester carboxylesterase
MRKAMIYLKSIIRRLLCLLVSVYSITGSVIAQIQKVDVDGAMIAVQTSGLETRKEGSPVIVFETGFGTPMGHWDTILKQASALAPTVAYDRPGIGDSQPDQQIPTVRNVADRLRKLLAVLKVKPPYVLVGHSLGGVYVRGFAKYYPKDLVGVVIIDPADFTETYDHIAQFMLDAGLEKNYVDSTLAQRRITAFQPDPKMPLSLQRELNVLFDLRRSEFAEFRNDGFPDIPLSFITSGRYDPMPNAKPIDKTLFDSKIKFRVHRWIQFVDTVPKGRFLYSANAGHFVHRDDPELVLYGIKMALHHKL